MPYADWKAPKQDGERLVWPDASALPGVVRDNHERLANASHALIQNTPLAALRNEARAFIGRDERDLLIMTGHQTELWHPGVWAKNALIDAIARKVNGVAIHMAVDTDAPKQLNIRWPGYSTPITDDERLPTASWSAQLDPPTPAHLAAIESSLKAAQTDFGYEPLDAAWIAAMRDAVHDGSSGSDLSKAIAAASHQLDWSLGLRYEIMTLSPLLNSVPWLAFVHHVLAHGETFASTYNSAIAEYRVEQGIKSTTRPMPDLAVAPDHLELPFWTDNLATGERARTTILRRGDVWCLVVNDDAFELDPALDAHVAAQRLAQFLRKHNHRLTPRALTLMLFTRLLIADLFVHGIGGGRYDQITDRIIRKHWGLTPPAFAVSTATLFLPQALGRERVCMPCLLSDGHKLRHASLGARKRELVEAIAAAPRGSSERGRLFAQMQKELREAREADERLLRWRDTLEVSKKRLIEDATVFDREVFYAIQPRERLEAMIAGYRADLGITVVG